MANLVERIGYGVMNWVGKFRKTDPDTSVAAAFLVPSKNIRLRMIALFNDPVLNDNSHHKGWTGHEIASHLGIKLNSVTPRFAELGRLGIIKPSHSRRDGQIVWILKDAE